MPNNSSIKDDSWYLKVITRTGDTLIITFALLLIIIMRQDQLANFCLRLLAIIYITGILVFLIKQVFQKQRPPGTYGSSYRKFDQYSFPSGHSARLSAMLFIAFEYSWIMGSIFLLWTGLVSYSRWVLKLHFLIDIVAGIGIGLLIGFACFYFQLLNSLNVFN